MQDQPSLQAPDEFVEQLAQEMLEFCGPIFIAPGLDTGPEQMIANGTYSLIDTGQKRLLITCHHVWQAHLDNLAENPKTVPNWTSSTLDQAVTNRITIAVAPSAFSTQRSRNRI